MRCTFCERKAAHEMEFNGSPVMYLCESCGRAFREGFEKGRIYQSAARRKAAGGPVGVSRWRYARYHVLSVVGSQRPAGWRDAWDSRRSARDAEGSALSGALRMIRGDAGTAVWRRWKMEITTSYDSEGRV